MHPEFHLFFWASLPSHRTLRDLRALSKLRSTLGETPEIKAANAPAGPSVLEWVWPGSQASGKSPAWALTHTPQL